jgi:hypothetical protein
MGWDGMGWFRTTLGWDETRGRVTWGGEGNGLWDGVGGFQGRLGALQGRTIPGGLITALPPLWNQV